MSFGELGVLALTSPDPGACKIECSELLPDVWLLYFRNLLRITFKVSGDVIVSTQNDGKHFPEARGRYWNWSPECVGGHSRRVMVNAYLLSRQIMPVLENEDFYGM